MIASILANIQDYTFLGVKIFEGVDFLDLVIRLFCNLGLLLVLVRCLYYPGTRRRDYMFTFIMIGMIIFLMCFLLENVKLQIGMALGLFAVFGILRYRTVQISVREMTYLFMTIGVSVINALTGKKISWVDLIFANIVVIAIAWISETMLFRKELVAKQVAYDKIELIKHNKRAELLADLEKRTGYKIRKVEINRINFLKDSARLTIYYFEHEKCSQDAE